jgi:hypothetical protein
MSKSKSVPVSNQKVPGGNWPSKQPGKDSGTNRGNAVPSSGKKKA